MANRTILEQYLYETRERGLSHSDALEQMSWMFSEEQLALLDEIYQNARDIGYTDGKHQMELHYSGAV